MNLGGLHRIYGKGIDKHPIIDSYWLHMCHDHRWNVWKHCLGIVFCTHDEACHVFNKGLISPEISSFPCNQLFTGFIWILPLLSIYISGRIHSFQRLIEYLLPYQWHRLIFFLHLQNNLDLPTPRMLGLCQHRSSMSCCDSFSKCWWEAFFGWPLADCVPWWSPKRLVIGFRMIILGLIATVGYRAEIIIDIVIVDR